jgi:hypothetical protein
MIAAMNGRTTTADRFAIRPARRGLAAATRLRRRRSDRVGGAAAVVSLRAQPASVVVRSGSRVMP